MILTGETLSLIQEKVSIILYYFRLFAFFVNSTRGSFLIFLQGGRDLKGTKNSPKNLRTAAQSKDQTLTRGNLALSRNYYNRKAGRPHTGYVYDTYCPVRVIRGFKLGGQYAPTEGYRYFIP